MRYLILIIIISLSLGCKKESNSNSSSNSKCEGVECKNGGTCVNGACQCPTGYEGTLCENLSRDKFIGTFKGQGKNTTGTWDMTVIVTKNANAMKLDVSGIKDKNKTYPNFTAEINSTTSANYHTTDESTNINVYSDGTKLSVYWGIETNSGYFEGTR